MATQSLNPRALTSNVASIVAAGNLLFTIDPSGNLAQYNWFTSAATTLAASGGTYACDGNTLYRINPNQTQIDQLEAGVWVQYYSDGTKTYWQIVAVNGIVYVTEGTTQAQAGIYAIAGSPLTETPVGAPGTMFAGNDLDLYGLSPDQTQVWRFNDTSTGWVQVLPGLGSTTATYDTILAAGTQCAAILQDASEVHVYDSAVDSAGGVAVTAVPACGPNASYALTPESLFGISGSTVFMYDASQGQAWVPAGTVAASIGQIYGAGPSLLGLGSDGTLYLLSTEIDYPSWMGDLQRLAPQFANLSLAQLCMPGTHDSGTFRFVPSAVQVVAPFFGPAAGYAAAGSAAAIFAKTQSLTIAEQLVAGARFLDIRPRPLPVSGAVIVYHGSIPTAVSLTEVQDDLQWFLATYPSELVILYLNHLDAMGSQLDQFLQNVAATFTDNLVLTETYSGSTPIGTYLAQGKNLIIVVDNVDLIDDPSTLSSFWQTGTDITNLGAYSGTPSLSDLTTFVTSQLSQPQTPPWMLQCQMTPSAAAVTQGVPSGWWTSQFMLIASGVMVMNNVVSNMDQLSPAEMAVISKPVVQALLDPGKASSQNLNLFIVDFYDSSWTDLAVNVNVTRLGMTTTTLSEALRSTGS